MYEFTLLKLAAIFFKDVSSTRQTDDTLSSIIKHIEKLGS